MSSSILKPTSSTSLKHNSFPITPTKTTKIISRQFTPSSKGPFTPVKSRMSSFTPTSKPSTTFKLNPITPMRRLFLNLDLLKPRPTTTRHGKRHRRYANYEGYFRQVMGRSSAVPSPAVDTSSDPEMGFESATSAAPASVNHPQPYSQLFKEPGSSPSSNSVSHERPSSPGYSGPLALQNHDSPLDAVIITTLPSAPFSDHKHLVHMTHTQLVLVAKKLNARLPGGLQIPLTLAQASSDNSSDEEAEAARIPDWYLRALIEKVVGIRKDVPMAPKAKERTSRRGLGSILRQMRMNDDGGEDTDTEDQSPPTSPLAPRKHHRRASTSFRMGLLRPATLMERLMEVEEPESEENDSGGGERIECYYEDPEDVFSIERPTKKRRLSEPEEHDVDIAACSPSKLLFSSFSSAFVNKANSSGDTSSFILANSPKNLASASNTLANTSLSPNSNSFASSSATLSFYSCNASDSPSGLDTTFISIKPRYMRGIEARTTARDENASVSRRRAREAEDTKRTRPALRRMKHFNPVRKINVVMHHSDSTMDISA